MIKDINQNVGSIELKKDENSIVTTLLYGAFLGLVGLVGYPFTIAGIGLRLLFIAILIALATFIVGFFTGTLFGMPKRNSVNEGDYTLNNSLVEISDWLTKIIVGLGLVNLKQVPKYLMSLGKYVSDASNSKGQSLDVFAMSIVVYFAIFGLYIGYNYMRLILSQKYKQADDVLLKRALEEKKQETKELQTKIQEKDRQTDALIKEANQPVTSHLDITSEPYLDEMKRKAIEKLKKGIVSNGNDPQKSQWGKLAEKNDRKLEAEVKEVVFGFYSIILKVESTSSENLLEDNQIILFALHQTFGTEPFRYAKVINGVAQIKLLSYGSFTVGAFVDKGKIELELDLAELPGVSDYFKEH